MQNSRNTYIQIALKALFYIQQLYICSFKELYLFDFKEMIYLLTVKEILIHSKNVYLLTKSIIIRGNYILTRNYIHFKETYIRSVKEIYPRSVKTYLFGEVISIQGNMFV